MRRGSLQSAFYVAVCVMAMSTACDGAIETADTDSTVDEEAVQEGEAVCADLVAHSTECGVDPRDTEAAGRYCDDLFVVVPLLGESCIDGVSAYFQCLVDAPCGSDERTVCREELRDLSEVCGIAL